VTDRVADTPDDWLVTCVRPHLEKVLDEYVDHYNGARPLQGDSGSTLRTARSAE
jgi:hypothetical protein